ncbi:hypothetical protein KGF56_001291 [Candida oxycetoniae]|uniref:N-acetyltransferase domain-containing protein n=1 Tax=Candida oxycetoniae TaxID=497107 RepID=A0AAI9SZW4_9ASCO|nr:uncharacterized protein KGF56_001291 [Candida oxycetoniae]KAI3406072.1 hypothetical protein KGF56_001291 [Candida oxycetoniae]
MIVSLDSIVMEGDSVYQLVKGLPFAKENFDATPKVKTPVINFNLERSGKPVTLFNIHNSSLVPRNLIKVLCIEFNFIIEEGQTYPHVAPKAVDEFENYWFHHFASILIDGKFTSLKDANLQDLTVNQWNDLFLGTFYVKPNYIGRCSHVCNAGFVVNHVKRGLGLGKELGGKYLEIAPQLGYVYSVFNLVFETNQASLKIWDALGFERIGYVKNVAVLKGSNKLVGAYIFGKDLQPTS